MGTQETTLMVNYFLTGDLGKQQQGALSSYSKDIVSLQRTGEINSDAAQRLQETLGKGLFYLVTLPDKDVTVSWSMACRVWGSNPYIQTKSGIGTLPEQKHEGISITSG